jgi:hypothetical protein
MKRVIEFLHILKCRILTWYLVIKYDKPTKIHIKSKNLNLNINGFDTFSSQEIFDCSISDFANTADLNNFKFDNNGLFFNNTLPDNLLKIILSSKRLEDIVFSYLGCDARLDDMYIKCQAPNSKSISEGWHTDNVGFRLKMFIAFKASEDSPKTILIPKSHLNSYSFPIKEILNRFFYMSNIPILKSLSSNNFTKYENELKLGYKNDVIHVFDTNCLHRGDYAEYSSVRNCIVLEFINKNKSNSIYRFSPCGPGQQSSGKIMFSEELSSFLENSKLIDKNILHKLSSSKYYSYSIKF